jgi:protein O-GlcNAc transferase
MKKIISFSLWGDSPKYTQGAIRNAELALEVYPGWTCRYYVGKSVPIDIIKQLMEFDNTELYIMKDPGGKALGTFWRFFAASDLDVDVMISRDVDSRLTLREKSAVDEWLDSDKEFHIMRDNPYHNVPILAGMWGVRDGLLAHMIHKISEFKEPDVWFVDQNFLRDVIYPLVRGNVFVHDEFFGEGFGEVVHPFKFERDTSHFIGQAYAGNDKILDPENYGNEFFIDRLKGDGIKYESTR